MRKMKTKKFERKIKRILKENNLDNYLLLNMDKEVSYINNVKGEIYIIPWRKINGINIDREIKEIVANPERLSINYKFHSIILECPYLITKDDLITKDIYSSLSYEINQKIKEMKNPIIIRWGDDINVKINEIKKYIVDMDFSIEINFIEDPNK